MSLFDPEPDALPDHGRFHSGGTDTEIAAAMAMQPKIGTQQDRVLRALRLAGENGRTDEESSRAARIRYPHTAGTRREELIDAGWNIVDSGRRRMTSSGRQAIVWVLR